MTPEQIRAAVKIDGVELTPGDRIQITGQPRWWRRLWHRLLRKSLTPENGIYVVSHSSWRKP